MLFRSAAGVAADAIVDCLQGASIAPVLTAHPTEVQRKSILDLQAHVAALLTARDTPQTADEVEHSRNFFDPLAFVRSPMAR